MTARKLRHRLEDAPRNRGARRRLVQMMDDNDFDQDAADPDGKLHFRQQSNKAEQINLTTKR